MERPKFKNVWRFAPISNKHYGDKVWEEVWGLCREHGCIGLGYGATLKDLRDYKVNTITPASTRDAVRTLMKIRPGDLIIANRGQRKVVGVGIVEEEGYMYRPDFLAEARKRKDRPHSYTWRQVLKVAWRPDSAGQLSGGYGINWRKTLSPVLDAKNKLGDKFFAELTRPLGTLFPTKKRSREQGTAMGDDTKPSPKKPPSLAAHVRRLLRTTRTHAVVLQGAPGTGKTHLSKKIGDRYRKQGGEVRQIQFHPAYSYEDFIEGLRPCVDQQTGQVSYDVKDGSFKSFCNAARERRNVPHVFIIDEINRGNIPKIFGEVMQCIEYRERQGAESDKHRSIVRLPYSQTDFSIPDNVHILGTMNTSDRSIALLDVALRRRFAFVTLEPEPSCLDAAEGKLSLLPNLLTCLNTFLKKVDPERMIGHTYFMHWPKNESRQAQWLQDKWYFEVLPLLKEYFTGRERDLQQILRDKYWWEDACLRTNPHGSPDAFLEAIQVFVDGGTGGEAEEE